MISVAPGVERYLLIYWPVQLQVARFGWFEGGSRTHDMMLVDAHIFKTGRRVGIRITRAKPLTNCFFSSERAQLAGGSR